MIIDRSHRNWAVLVLLATIVTSLIYIHQFRPDWLSFLPQPAAPQPQITPGRTTLGLVYGSVALAIFLFCCMLGWRRRRPALSAGSMQAWLRAHIWLSVFTIPLVLMHAGFITGGIMTTLLMTLYAIVMLSGFFGLALQQFLPRIMSDELPMEVVYEQIPYLRSQLFARAQEICEKRVKPSARFMNATAGRQGGGALSLESLPAVFPAKALRQIDDVVIPYLRSKKSKRLKLGNAQDSNLFFRLMRAEVPADLEPTVAALQELCDERRQLDLQANYHHWLHGWLIVHIPISVALLMLTLWHAVVAQFFG
ncbi:MAG TPA: hypothetical protein VL981_08505 [Candidatus Methylacidiphilales bacterium]|nr:hypothetical protein [Candidatus Methylacidiphilales bacterium]